MPNFFYDRSHQFRLILQRYGYDVRLANAALAGGGSAPVMIQFPTQVLGQHCIVALPDVHLSSGDAGDIFLNNDPNNPRRLTATLKAMRDFTEASPATTLLQLGDWYDVWRSVGADATSSQYSAIDSFAPYQELLGLDSALSLAHAYGNHDASFTHALPDGRVATQHRFRFGFGLGGSNGRVYALHGHQADSIAGEPNKPSDIRAVWLGTLAAKYISRDFTDLENFIDTQGGFSGAKDWLLSLVGLNRDDPQPSGRPRLAAPQDGQRWSANFVKREAMDKLVRIAQEAINHSYPAPNAIELLIVGHSHQPCIGWTPHPTTGRPVVVIDCGSWVYSAAQILFAAGNVACVYNIVPMGTP